MQKQKAAPQVVENAATLRLKLDEASPPARARLACSMRPHESMRSHGHLCVVLAVPAGQVFHAADSTARVLLTCNAA